jgi:hypothetical protein
MGGGEHSEKKARKRKNFPADCSGLERSFVLGCPAVLVDEPQLTL